MIEGWLDAQGIWRCRGYGRILEVDDDIVRWFDTTSVSCLELGRWSLESAAENYDRLVVRDQRLSLFERGGITRYDHDRIASVPVVGPRRDPLDPFWNFDVFWHAFDEHYEFFDVRGVDWDGERARHRPQVDGASPDELAEVLGQLVQRLGDPHVELDVGDRTIPSEDGRDSLAAWWRRDVGPARARKGFSKAIRELVERELGVRGARLLAGGQLVVGEIDETTGYLAILSMADLVDDAPATQPSDVRAAGDAIDQTLSELASHRSLIVDVRSNGGGWDAVSLAIAGRFADRSRVAFTKRARNGDGHTDRQAIEVEPTGRARFTGPVALLTSGSTGSAAEIFTLCMAALPQVTTVGAPTRGITSDELPKQLPNGWVVTVSNERYEDPAGTCYERVGIPPAVPVKPEVGESLTNHLRRGIQVAGRVLREVDRA